MDLQVTKLSGPDVPVLAPKHPAKYYLPTRIMEMVLPPECLHFPADLRLPAKFPVPGPGRTGKSEMTFPGCVLECTPITFSLTSTPKWPVGLEP